MSAINLRHLIIGLAMLLAAFTTLAMKPTADGNEGLGKGDLEKLVPTSFTDWRIDTSAPPQMVSPDLQASLDQIYSDTVTRTYINSQGERVMLSLAYGKSQSRTLQAHKPEVCYAAQGFQLVSMRKAELTNTIKTELPVMQLVARQGPRNEAITYWIRTGNVLVRGWYEQNLARFRYGLKGKIPDGLLFRVSSISPDPEKAFALQSSFVTDLLVASSPIARRQFVGGAGE